MNILFQWWLPRAAPLSFGHLCARARARVPLVHAARRQAVARYCMRSGRWQSKGRLQTVGGGRTSQVSTCSNMLVMIDSCSLSGSAHMFVASVLGDPDHLLLLQVCLPTLVAASSTRRMPSAGLASG